MYVFQVGAALNFDLLKYDEDTLTAFLRVYSKWVQQQHNGKHIFTPSTQDVFVYLYLRVCVCVFFQGLGEAVELPDSAGLVPETSLCLQSAAGQHIHSISVQKGPLCCALAA